MAADTRSIVVTLKLDNSSAGASDNENPTDGTDAANKTDKNSTAKAVAAFAVMKTAQLVTSEVVNWGEYYWNRELTLTDDYIGQRNKNIAMTQINRGISYASTIGSMAIAGTTIGGPIGTAVGAAIGIATSAVSIMRSNLQGQDQQNIHLRQMDAQLDFTRSRAGWSTQAASIGEDL